MVHWAEEKETQRYRAPQRGKYSQREHYSQGWQKNAYHPRRQIIQINPITIP